MFFNLKAVFATSDAELTATTNWPPPCCESKLGCDAGTLSQYCVCPPLCVDVGKCPCKFPGTDEILNPRPYKHVPVAPFCACARAKCVVKECPTEIEICTADAVQELINQI